MAFSSRGSVFTDRFGSPSEPHKKRMSVDDPRTYQAYDEDLGIAAVRLEQAVNIERLQDSTMIFTAVPLVGRDPEVRDRPGSDGIYEFGEGATVEVWPPKIIRIDPELWPISEDLESIETKPVELSVDPVKGGEAAPKADDAAVPPVR